MAPVLKVFDKDLIDRAVLRALQKTYVKELILRTPKKTGFTASQWSAYSLGDFKYLVTNPKGDIITYLEEGTRAHAIQAKSSKFLKFRIDKKPILRSSREEKTFTKKGFIFFFKGYGNPVLGFSREGSVYYCFAKKVNHPGFTGRRFMRQIAEDKNIEMRFKTEVLKAVA